jgi:excisionase family DNA binding protein
MTLLTVNEAAARLGVSTRQVQHLAARGELRLLARGVVDETSVDRYLAVRGVNHKRAWSEATAWGAVALLSGVTPTWMGESQRSRLKGRLRVLAATELLERSRERADVARYAGHSSTAARLRTELVDTAGAAKSLGLADTNSVDGYLATDALADVIARHGLIRDDTGRFTLRATTVDLAMVAELAGAGTALSALDLAESLDARERHLGLDALDDALARFRG